ncbi:MAG: DUF4350 domain-containing protein [Actinomycetota bacterium]|nr:DUF4350 domain-containing protein [Actinomycetota bacterium]
MSPRRATTEGGSGARVGVTALLLVLVAAGMMLLVRAQPDTEPFDPRSGEGSGTRGLVLLLERQGATVGILRAAPQPGDTQRVLVLQDRLNDRQRAGLLEFVEGGGVVLMADPGSTLGGQPAEAATIDGEVPYYADVVDVESQINVRLGTCDVGALGHLRGLFVRDGVRLRAGSGDRVCFGGSSSGFALVQARGQGLIVRLGDNELFTNSLLRYADNGALATALLAPQPGARVGIMLGEEAAKTAADIGTGERTLSDLVRPGVWMAFTQLAIAFVLFAIARAIRPGRPVREPEQVPIAGSELVVATGNLMQRAQHAQRAGWLLRGNTYRALCRRFQLPSTASIDALDAAVAARGPLPPGAVSATLQREVHDNAALLRLSGDLQALRDATLSEPSVGEGANQ